MNKKGFTLVEIIICISLIIIIGLGSIFTINFISNKKLITKLNEITDRAINAAQVYIETNKEVNNQLYNNKNGVSLPLQLLVKEGLLNLDNTGLTEKDIKNQYVVTFLGSTNSKDVCEQITSTTSWGNDKEIYLCLNNANVNVIVEDSNYDKITKNNYTFKGSNPNNYIKYKDKIYRIFSVEQDDSLMLVSKDSFGNIFEDSTYEIQYYERASWEIINNVVGNDCEGTMCIVMQGEQKKATGEVLLSLKDIVDTAEISRKERDGYSKYDILNSYITEIMGLDSSVAVYGYSGTSYRSWKYPTIVQGYKIHINNCFKIIEGIGTETVPYVLEKKC